MVNFMVLGLATFKFFARKRPAVAGNIFCMSCLLAFVPVVVLVLVMALKKQTVQCSRSSSITRVGTLHRLDGPWWVSYRRYSLSLVWGLEKYKYLISQY